MKIFVINLKRRTDRREFMEKQLHELGLEAEFIEAVDGRSLTKEEQALYDENFALQKNRKKLSPGELGCALSHRKIYEKMIRENISEATILEDDVCLSKEFANLLMNKNIMNSTWSWLQIDYPLIDLISWVRSSGWHIKRNPLFIFYVLIKMPYMVPLFVYEHVRERLSSCEQPYIAYFPRPLYFASCYVVRLSAARVLLELATPVVYPADRLPNQARLKKGFLLRAVVPRAVFQMRSEFISDIDKL